MFVVQEAYFVVEETYSRRGEKLFDGKYIKQVLLCLMFCFPSGDSYPLYLMPVEFKSSNLIEITLRGRSSITFSIVYDPTTNAVKNVRVTDIAGTTELLDAEQRVTQILSHCEKLELVDGEIRFITDNGASSITFNAWNQQ